MEQIHTYDENEVMFHNFDVHVSKVQATDMTCIATLIEYFKKPIIEDKYKEIYIAREFLAWMSHMETYEMKDLPDEIQVLLKEHPAFAFSTLCKSANIQHQIIYGIGKNMEYIPGQTADDDGIIQTAWIAFKTEERWHLVDPQKVLSTIQGHIRGGEILLESQGRPILAEQTATAVLEQNFFKAKLHLLSEQACVLHSKNGRCTVTFGASKSSARYISMIYQLSLRKGTGDLTGLNVQDLPLLVMYAPGIDTFSFSIRFPVAAEYIFETYVSAPGIDGDSYNICSEFKIICPEPDPNCKKLPLDVGSIGYGFGYSAVDFGLKNPSTPQANVAVKCKENDDVEMKELTFQIEDDKINEVEFSSDIAGDENKENVVTETRVDEVSGKLHVKAGVKKEGEYALSIIARDKQSDQHYRSIVNYLLTTNSSDEDKDIQLRSKKRKRGLTLESRRQDLLDKKNALSERIKAMECEIGHLKKMYEENRNNKATQTEEVPIDKQLTTETKSTQTGDTLCLQGEATQTDIITTLVSDKETQCEDMKTEIGDNSTEAATSDDSKRFVLKAVEKDGNIVVIAEKLKGEQTNGPDPAAQKSKMCAVL